MVVKINLPGFDFAAVEVRAWGVGGINGTEGTVNNVCNYIDISFGLMGGYGVGKCSGGCDYIHT